MGLPALDDRVIKATADLIIAGLRGRRYATEEAREAKWRRFITRAAYFEARFIRALQRYFAAQEADVLSRFPVEKSMGVTKDISDVIIFDRPMWENRMKIVGAIYTKEAMDAAGKDEMAGLLVGVGFDVESQAAQEFVATNSIKLAGEVTDTTIKAIREQLAYGIREGESMPELSRRVRSVFGEASRERSLMIARSETIKASNFGAVESYRQSGVVSGKQWYCASGERTCDWCLSLHEKIIELDDNFFDQGDRMVVNERTMKLDYSDVGYPPLHPNCRCTVLPILKEIGM